MDYFSGILSDFLDAWCTTALHTFYFAHCCFYGKTKKINFCSIYNNFFAFNFLNGSNMHYDICDCIFACYLLQNQKQNVA